jgi:hypothetical protein
MIRLLFSGCSIVQGIGLDLENQNSMHYANVLAAEMFGDDVLVTNIGVGGYSNLRIFLDTCVELTKSAYDFVFVGWTSYPRHYTWLGLEPYDCTRVFKAGHDLLPFHGNDLSFSDKFLHKLRDDLCLISNAHYDILDIVRYVNILSTLAKSKKTKIYFLNNYCHWDKNFFKKKSKPIKSNSLTKYTNTILNSYNRNDDQINLLYDKIHNDYQSVGGIQEQLWLNLYQPMVSMLIDLGNDNSHPGPLSHESYGKFLSNKLRILSSKD